MEIANDHIPNIVKTAGDGHHAGALPKVHQNIGQDLLHDADSYSNLLRFYDGICEWEEGSQTPVLHVGWAKFMCFSLSRFDPSVRQGMDVHAEGEEDEEENGDEEEKEKEKEKEKAPPVQAEVVTQNVEEVNSKDGAPTNGEGGVVETRKRRPGRRPKAKKPPVIKGKPAPHSQPADKGSDDKHVSNTNGKTKDSISRNGPVDGHVGVNGNSLQDEERIKTTIQELESKVGAQESQNETTNPNIVALAHACGESILNPEYLLSGGEPFTTQTTTGTSPAFAHSTDTRVDFNEFLSSKSNGSPFRGMTMDSMLKAESPADMLLFKSSGRPDSAHSAELSAGSSEDSRLGCEPGPSLTLHSAKMKGLKNLLTSAKLNASAIKLQLTAQSQVQLKHSKVNSEYEFTLPRKRLRRE